MNDPAVPDVLPAEVIDSLIRSAMALDIHAWLAQRLPRIEGPTPENHEKASLAQQQLRLADQLAAARELAGAGQLVAPADQQDFEALTAAAAIGGVLVFGDPEPEAGPTPIRYWDDRQAARSRDRQGRFTRAVV
jgi:hypothetical protein